jgi:hypothetical protein
MGYRVKNWKSFQHYKTRRPPWIRLHRSLLENPKFMRLPNDSKVLAMLFWLIASENKDPKSGAIDDDHDDIAYRLHMTPEKLAQDLKPLIDKGFIEVDSAMLAGCQQNSASETETETETEVETETETEVETESRRKPRASKPVTSPDDLENLRLAWNSMAETCGLPAVRGYGSPASSNTRLNNAKARLADAEWLTAYPSALERIPLSESMTGKKPPSRGYETPWRMTFDQFVRAETVTKILEGLHDDRKAPDMYQGPEVDWSNNVRINGADQV